jgi:hypothetical protein
MALLLILAIVITLTALVVATLLFTGKIKIGSSHKKGDTTKDSGYHAPKKKCTADGHNTIAPKPFKTGAIKNSPQSSANACGDGKFRYAINLPGVDYGLPPVSDDCLCTEFIKAP